MSLVVLLGSGYMWWTFNNFTSSVPRLNVFQHNSAAPAHDIDGKDQNILIVGNDDRSDATPAELKALSTGSDGGSLNTDTMMIVHVPANGAKATLISLPRDSYVDIPGYTKYKLNSAYPDAYNATPGSLQTKRSAGAAELVNTVEQLTGITIDHFVQVDLLGFYRISEAIPGGVPVDMCHAVKESNSGINLPAGVSYIKGTQALAFVRQRYGFPNGLGDLDRVERQRYFLTAAFRRVTSLGVLLNPFKLRDLLQAVQSSLYMDSSLNPLSLAQQLENLSANNITGVTIPTEGFGYAASDNSSVVLVDPATVKSFIQKLVNPPSTATSTVAPADPRTVTLDVLNAGSGVNGAAAAAADVLRGQGFTVAQVGDATNSSGTTVVDYSSGQEAAAKAIARYVPGATMQEVSGLSHPQLLIGADGLTAKVPSSSAPATTSSSGSSASSSASSAPAIDSGCIN